MKANRFCAWVTIVCALLGANKAARAASFGTEEVASGLTNPLFVTAPAGDTNQLFVVEQGVNGTADIKILNLANDTINPTPFLTISGIATSTEQGLLGLAFDPNYASNGKFYVDYTADGGSFNAGVTHITQYSVSANPNLADANSATDLLTIDQPQANHNGGWIGFSNRPGDSGNLYIAMGDGGNGEDVGPGHNPTIGNAQDTNSLLGKILRITPDVGAGPTSHPNYTTPAGNPFADGGGAPEVFVYGLRNPFRDSFDRATGNLFIGDVGQGTREEVDLQNASNPNGGENYGWNVREGRVQNPAFPNTPTPANAVDPIYDYTHADPAIGQVEIGGYVYRGSAIPSLQGMYIFADDEGPLDPINNPDDNHSQIFAINSDGLTATNQALNLTTQLSPPGSRFFNISSFGEDASGELYITDLTAGAIFKIVPTAIAVPLPTAFTLLSLLSIPILSLLFWQHRNQISGRKNPLFGRR